MIIQEQISETLVKTYSDIGMMVHGGFPEGDYAEAIDPIIMNRTYTETDIPIPIKTEQAIPEETSETFSQEEDDI